MPKLITFSAFMLFWVFYETSGGAAFQPEKRVIASNTPFTKADEHASGAVFFHSPVILRASVPENTTNAPAQIASTPETQDLRYVDARRVNLRQGPSTTEPVLDTISRGTAALVINLNDDGWAQIRLTETGQTGWMATRLLSQG